MSPRSGSSLKRSESTHALRRLQAIYRQYRDPSRPTDNDDRVSPAIEGYSRPYDASEKLRLNDSGLWGDRQAADTAPEAALVPGLMLE
jgi:hypothetical protein